jgi:hypothetical protein
MKEEVKEVEKTRKRRKLSFIAVFTFFAVFLLLTSGFSTIYASSTSTKATLPDFLEKLLITALPDATEEELNHIRAIWIKQIELKEERIAATNGAVLNYKPSGSRSASYMSDYLYKEEFGGGRIYNPSNMEGAIDYNFARFYTPDEDQGASIVGNMSNPTSTGDVYVVAKLGPTGSGQNGNYVLVYGAYDPYEENQTVWLENFIGYAEITYPYSWPGAPYVYIGSTSNEYPSVSVGVTTVMGGECTYNDVLGDIVYFTNT